MSQIPDSAAFPPVNYTIDLLQELLTPDDRVRLFWLLGNEGDWQARFEPVEKQRSQIRDVIITSYGEAVKIEVIRRDRP